MANKCWTKPAVYIHSDVDKELRNELKDIVKRHDGKIVGKLIVNKIENKSQVLILLLWILFWYWCILPALSKKIKTFLILINAFSNFILEEEEDATHIVYEDQDPLDDEFARGAMRRDKQTLFHFYYMPDSYDSWAAGVELDYDPPESPQFPDHQWKVSLGTM